MIRCADLFTMLKFIACELALQVIISGANLSEDYFTSRQDRYMVFRTGELNRGYPGDPLPYASPFAGYLHRLVAVFGKYSHSSL